MASSDRANDSRVVDLAALKNGGAVAGGPNGAGLAAGRSGNGNGNGNVPGASGSGTGGAGGVVRDVSAANFAEVVTLSDTTPVILVIMSPRSPASVEMTDKIAAISVEKGGAFYVAKVDVDAVPDVAQALQVQSVPTVLALLKQQPMPLFQGSASDAEVRQVMDEVVTVATKNGIAGTVPLGEAAAQAAAEPAPLPPLHQAAIDAIEKGDLAAAEAAYAKALAENPGDDDAKAGLAQVKLMQRAENAADPQALILAADNAPKDVEAGLAAADAELTLGQTQEAFDRLLALIRMTHDDERESVRVRIIDYFEIVGADDPAVGRARRALFSALY